MFTLHNLQIPSVVSTNPIRGFYKAHPWFLQNLSEMFTLHNLQSTSTKSCLRQRPSGWTCRLLITTTTSSTCRQQCHPLAATSSTCRNSFLTRVILLTLLRQAYEILEPKQPLTRFVLVADRGPRSMARFADRVLSAFRACNFLSPLSSN